jgi:hypothetical protein
VIRTKAVNRRTRLLVLRLRHRSNTDPRAAARPPSAGHQVDQFSCRQRTKSGCRLTPRLWRSSDPASAAAPRSSPRHTAPTSPDSRSWCWRRPRSRSGRRVRPRCHRLLPGSLRCWGKPCWVA